DVVVLEPGVTGPMFGERQRGGLDDDVVERDFSPRLVAELLVESLARFGGPLHVHFAREKEVGNGAERRGQAPRDRLADLGQGNVFIRSSGALGNRETGNG